MSRRAKNGFVLPGTHIRQMIYQSEREEAKIKAENARFERAEQNYENMMVFVKYLHSAFDMTSINHQIERLISSWAQYGYNKSVYFANIMVCNIIKESPHSESLFSRWKEQLQAFCNENDFQYERFSMTQL